MDTTTQTKHEALCALIDAASLDHLTTLRRLRREIAYLEEQADEVRRDLRAFPDPQTLYAMTYAEVAALAEDLAGLIDAPDALFMEDDTDDGTALVTEVVP